MRAALLLSRCEIRRRWPGLLVLAVLVALTGGVTLTAVAGARRTASSFDRFLDVSRNDDVTVFADDVRPADVDKLRKLPGVEELGYARGMLLVGPNGQFLAAGGALDEVIFRDIDRLRILDGRPVRPGATDEVVIGEPLARVNGLHVGMLLNLKSYSPAQSSGLRQRGDVGKPEGPQLRLRIVGISRSPGDLSLQGSDGGVLLLSKALVDKYGTRIGTYAGPHAGVLLVRVHDHAAGVPQFLDQVRTVLPKGSFDVDPTALSVGGVQESIDLLAIAVLALGVATATAGLIALALVLSRHTSLIAARQAPVRDLGLPRRARASAIAAPVLLAVALGTAVAMALAWVASPLLPIGVAREAEPHPGIHFDVLVLPLGALTIILIVGGIVAVQAWRAAGAQIPEHTVLRPSLLTRALENVGLAPPARIGVRMALERRSGRTTIPVRSSLIGAGVAVLGLVAVAVFGASLQHLHDTPSAYGRPWDVRVADTRTEQLRPNDPCGPVRTRLTNDSDAEVIANACTVDIELNGRAIGAFGMTPVRGAITPTVLAGRAPRRADEVALGTKTVQALKLRLGDHVTARTRSGAFEYLLVGKVAVPGLSDPQAVADGAVLTGDGVDRLVRQDENGTSSYLLVRFRSGVDKSSAAARIRALPGIGRFQEPGVVAVAVPLEVERLEQIHRMPLLLGAFLALVGAIAIGHLLVTSVRRRRRDFAVLKSVGFTRRQILATVSWQASTIAAAGVLVGLSLGLLVGTLLWHAIAHQVGVLAHAEVPAELLAAIGLSTFLIVNIIAAFPARSAAHTQPAVALRSE
jgi:hypothetical protein